MMTPLQDAPRLLLVDDIEDNRLVLLRRFVKRGFQIVEAESGIKALEMIERERIDAVLLDIMMPQMDGIEVLKIIRARYSPDQLPVIMVTGKSFSEDIAGALEQGANDYVTKPVDFPVVFARVQSQLARVSAQKALQEANAILIETNHRLANEIAGRERSDAQIHHMTHYDALTGVGNRVLLQDYLAKRLTDSREAGAQPVLIHVVLDSFKAAIAGLEQFAVDLLLKNVASRLREIVCEHDLLARVGEVEFAIALATAERPGTTSRLIDRIIDVIPAPCDINGHEIVLSCAIGIAMVPADGADADTLMRNAQMACHDAAAEGRNKFCYFEAEINARAHARRALESDLRKAAAAEEFKLFYQPLFDFRSSSVSGFEALMRWDQKTRGMISPAEFVPIAEQLGIIIPMGDWALQQACADAARTSHETKFAVNISAVQLQNHGLLSSVVSALDKSRLAPSRLELEITETVLLGDNGIVLEILHQLRSLGIRVSLDDFGTGYSSFNYLRMFPFDKIKIDQCFTRELATSANTRAMVRAIIGLANELGVTTTAEGVETHEQFEWLKTEGCTEAQGYLISRPMPGADIESFLSLGQERWLAA